MPRYTYSAKSRPQKILQGQIEAASESEAVTKLNAMGYFPLSLVQTDLAERKEGISTLMKIPAKDISLLTGQLASLLQSGVNIVNSLRIASNQVSNSKLRLILSDIVREVTGGKSLSESFSAYPNIFSGLYTAMIHSGEVSGNIETTMTHLADFMEKEEEFKNSLTAALIYPLFLLLVSALTVIVLLTFVMPRLVSMFEDMGQVLPIPTKLLINISSLLRGYWWLLGAILCVLTFAWLRGLKNPLLRFWYDEKKLKLPGLGAIVKKTEISRLMRTLSLLLSSGMAIISSLDVAISVLDNQVLRKEVKGFKDKLSKGESLSSCLESSKFFPDFATNIVQTGEESGTLEKALSRIATEYEKEVDRTLKTLTRLLEPIIILAMGLIVGFIVISMLLPIFQINLIVQ